MSKQYFDSKKVRGAAHGQWLAILLTLAPHLEGAIRKAGRHTPCPIHGGKDGFRLFKDTHLTGGGVCNTCGPRADGISLLMWCNDWDYPTTLQHVAGLIGVEPETKKNMYRQTKTAKPANTVKETKPASVKKASSCYIGSLGTTGVAPYQNNQENHCSFFVELVSKNGHKRTLWGVDLERAIKQSGAAQGDLIGLKNIGQENVTAEKPNGKKIQARRNTWEIEVLKSNSKPEVQDEVSPTLKVQEESEHFKEGLLVDQTATVSFYQNKPWLAEVQAGIEARIKRDEEYAKTLHARIKTTWERCTPLGAMDADVARMYLNSRGLSARGISSDSLRFTPNMPYHDEDGNKLGEYPTIVAAIRDVKGDIVTLHRIYLSDSGTKAHIPGGGSTKKMMSIPYGLDVKGCAIQLATPCKGVLGVAEGIETAMSAFRATGVPTWAAVSAVLLENLQVPEDVHTVIIWADKDMSMTGERSAEVLKTRLEEQGINCLIMLPDMAIPKNAKSVDWNDVLVQQGIMGFPAPRRLRIVYNSASEGK